MRDAAWFLKCQTALICLVLILANSAMADDGKENRLKLPLFQLEDYQKVIGPVPEGAPVPYRLKIRNKGDGLLKLAQFRIWKGSKIIHAPKEILPGEIETVTLSLKTLNAGKKALRGVTILTNEPGKSRVHRIGFDLLITPQIDVVPDRFFLSGLEGTQLKADIQIKGNLKSQLVLTVHEGVPDDKFTFKLKRNEKSGVHTLSINNLQNEPGSYRGRIVLKTSYPDKPFVVMPVFTRVLSKIDITPNELDFGRIGKSRYLKPGETLDKQASPKPAENPVHPVFVRINTDETLEITGMSFEENNDFFSARVKMIEKDRIYRIDVTARVEKLPAKEVNTVLVIQTKHPEYQSIRVPVKVMVQ